LVSKFCIPVLVVLVQSIVVQDWKSISQEILPKVTSTEDKSNDGAFSTQSTTSAQLIAGAVFSIVKVSSPAQL
jgi:hypothetical protein